jgi:uncharacterized membrane-anchored protein YitT (DUF2179 family)
MVKLAFQLALIALATAFVSGFVAVPLVILSKEGPSILMAFVEAPFAIFGLLFLGLFGAIYSVIVAALPVMLIGSLLYGLRIRDRRIWAGVGAVAGAGCYLAARLLPTGVGHLVRDLSAPTPLLLVPAFAVAGTVAALFFRFLVDLFAGFDQWEPETMEAA